MHLLRVTAFHEVRSPATASKEHFQFLVLDSRQNGGIVDLVAIEVQNGQHRPVGNRIEKLIGLPCGGQRTRFRFTIADDTGDDQIWIVERGPEGMTERIPQLATFVDRARRCRARHDPRSRPEKKIG